ncbi:hypothetical protein [Azospirillum agricola]|uniref:hypothetical protein n=1 Tax=Azospirillum agricola TaxID=1720247 RepID=UPI000A0F11CD|nr:hypothetical protein [Azospirillum agricola]SMH54660.1 hypothetical protein SAMN02982994_3674 [Azospirillum lipoferum]
MWHDYTNALITAFGLAGLGFGIGQLVIVCGERMIEKRHGTSGVRDVIARRAKMETLFEARRADRVGELREADGAVQELLGRRASLERRIKEAQQSGERLVRLVGEEVAGTPCYLAMVANKYVGTSTFQQKEHALIDSSWAQPQSIEVWAKSMAEARAEIERRYPPAFGYVVTRMQDIGAAAAPVAKAG